MDYAVVTHADYKRWIKASINITCSSYAEIGWMLNQINARELYKDGKYKGIGEYAAAEYGISKDRCSWLMKVADKFCDKHAPELLPEYEDFSISKT